MKIKRKTRLKTKLLLSSLCLAGVSVSSVVLSSCSVFVPETDPHIPPPKPPLPPEQQKPNIDFSTSKSVWEYCSKLLKQVEKDFNKNFANSGDKFSFPKFDNFWNNQTFTSIPVLGAPMSSIGWYTYMLDLRDGFYTGYFFGKGVSIFPNNPPNFNPNSPNFNFYLERQKNNLLNRLFMQWKEWYNKDDANYISTAYINYIGLLKELITLYYYGMNVILLEFYEYLATHKEKPTENGVINNGLQENYFIWELLPYPDKKTPYINLFLTTINKRWNEKKFQSIYPSVIRNWFGANQVHILFKYYSVPEMFFSSFDTGIRFMKYLMGSKVPPSFQNYYPNMDHTAKNFFEFYLHYKTEDDLKKLQAYLKNGFETAEKISQYIFRYFMYPETYFPPDYTPPKPPTKN